MIYSPFPAYMSRDVKVCHASAVGPAFFRLGPETDYNSSHEQYKFKNRTTVQPIKEGLTEGSHWNGQTISHHLELFITNP